MAGEVLVDALPYHDKGYDEPGEKEAVIFHIIIYKRSILLYILLWICKDLFVHSFAVSKYRFWELCSLGIRYPCIFDTCPFKKKHGVYFADTL